MSEKKRNQGLSRLTCPVCKNQIYISKKVKILKCKSCSTKWKNSMEFFKELEHLITGPPQKIERPFQLINAQIPLKLTRQRKILRLVKVLPKEASVEVLNSRLEPILKEIQLSTLKEKSNVYKALKVLRNQPSIINVLINKYKSLQKESTKDRLQIIRVIGSLGRKDSLPFLEEIVQTPLPSINGIKSEFPERDEQYLKRKEEEIIMMKAVHGVGYIRTKKSFDLLTQIIKDHESPLIRITAIDTYMWNHNDSESAAEKLYEILAPEYLKYVKRPRFHRNIKINEFNQELTTWISRWGEK